MRTTRTTLAACALAAMIGGAQAQQVTLHGLLDLAVAQSKPAGGVRSRGVESGLMTTSYIGLRGSEDLGGGLAAQFRLEHFLRADTGAAGRFAGDGFWSRTASVGLASRDWGSVSLGRNTTPLFVATLLFNPFGDSFGFSPAIRHHYTSGTVSGDSAWNDSILYASPSFGGLRFGAIVAANDEGAAGGRNWGFNLGYANGPFAASLVLQDVEKDGALGAVPDTRTVQLAGSWQLGKAAKLFAQLSRVDNRSTGNEFDLVGLGASVPLGAGSVLAYWGRISPETGARRSTLSLGYDHFLSKRTDVYLAAMSDRVSGLPRGHALALGVRHRF
jgi:predicted porin